MADNLSFGQLCSQFRERAQLTLEDFANRIGIPDFHVESIENGNWIPDRELTLEICKQLNLSTNNCDVLLSLAARSPGYANSEQPQDVRQSIGALVQLTDDHLNRLFNLILVALAVAAAAIFILSWAFAQLAPDEMYWVWWSDMTLNFSTELLGSLIAFWGLIYARRRESSRRTTYLLPVLAIFLLSLSGVMFVLNDTKIFDTSFWQNSLLNFGTGLIGAFIIYFMIEKTLMALEKRRKHEIEILIQLFNLSNKDPLNKVVLQTCDTKSLG